MWEALPVLFSFHSFWKVALLVARGECLTSVPAAATWPVSLTYYFVFVAGNTHPYKAGRLPEGSQAVFAICLMEMLLTGDEHLAL